MAAYLVERLRQLVSAVRPERRAFRRALRDFDDTARLDDRWEWYESARRLLERDWSRADWRDAVACAPSAAHRMVERGKADGTEDWLADLVSGRMRLHRTLRTNTLGGPAFTGLLDTLIELDNRTGRYADRVAAPLAWAARIREAGSWWARQQRLEFGHALGDLAASTARWHGLDAEQTREVLALSARSHVAVARLASNPTVDDPRLLGALLGKGLKTAYDAYTLGARLEECERPDVVEGLFRAETEGLHWLLATRWASSEQFAQLVTQRDWTETTFRSALEQRWHRGGPIDLPGEMLERGLLLLLNERSEPAAEILARFPTIPGHLVARLLTHERRDVRLAAIARVGSAGPAEERTCEETQVRSGPARPSRARTP